MIFTGFDSAWGGRETGALCDLAPASDSGYTIRRVTRNVSWDVAVKELSAYADPDHVVSIDQPLVVRNESGMRPVEAKLASALMKDFACGAHAANTTNACFGPRAGIWEVVERLQSRGYKESPRDVAERRSGKHFFECYPHPAILGLFDLPKVVRYKVRHRDGVEWSRLLSLVATLESGAPAVRNVSAYFPATLTQNKPNEDALDAFIAAYVGAFLHEHGLARSLIIGDLGSGYMVTPVSDRLRAALVKTFGPAERNPEGSARSTRPTGCASLETQRASALARPDRMPSAPQMPMGERQPVETLCVNDTSNIWGKVNPWLRQFDRDVFLTFMDEEGSPTLRFVPFRSQGDLQRGLKIGTDLADRAVWIELSRGASRTSPASFSVKVEFS